MSESWKPQTQPLKILHTSMTKHEQKRTETVVGKNNVLKGKMKTRKVYKS